MNKKVIIAILVISAALTAGFVIFGIVGYATAGTIEKSYQFSYTNSSIFGLEDIDIDFDLAKVDINYNSTPMDAYMEANLSVLIEGLFMEGKSFANFFSEPITANNSADKNIQFLMKQDQWFDPSTWFSTKIVTLHILLRTDVEYNIDVDVSVGDLSVNVPENVSVGALELLTSTGSISADLSENSTVNTIELITSTGNIGFKSQYINHTGSIRFETATGNIDSTISNGIIDGNIRILTSTGNSLLRFYNLTYEANNVWDIDGSTGNIDIHIQQYDNMNANVSGSAITSTGNVYVYYQDWSNSVGVRLDGTTSTGSAEDYTSSDFATATFHYDLALTTSTGNVNIDHTDQT
ncbi:MAG: hypothetical protein BAJALOKI3v1_570005 [Promethearchaeota archaeon]|nr:MAG: hypothetical protein BAJALOKI3v1_570005 [Candidatus Lokiarchaeota archaeon]